MLNRNSHSQHNPSTLATEVPVEIEMFRFPSSGDAHWHQFGREYRLTCRHHRYLRWHTKNPYERNLYFLPPTDEATLNTWNRDRRLHPEMFATSTGECTCAFTDMMVLVELNELELISSKPVPKTTLH